MSNTILKGLLAPLLQPTGGDAKPVPFAFYWLPWWLCSGRTSKDRACRG
jgi:hypothetical protein